MFGFQPFEPPGLLGACQVRRSLFREREEVPRVATGEKGALTTYGKTGQRPELDRRRT